jgi:hypothetical protein
MANQFDVEVANPVQALLMGQKSYDAAQATAKENARRSALQTLLSGGDGGTPDFGKAASAIAASGDLDGAAKLATIGKALAPPETASAVQEFKFAQGNGYKGSLLDFMKEKAAAGATRVNNNTSINTGDKAYDTAINKDLAETHINALKAGTNAQGTLNTIGVMEKAASDPNFYSGTAAPLVTMYKKGAASLGIEGADSAAPNELFGKMANKLVMDSTGGSLGAGISNADRSFIEGTVPNLTNTPSGNKAIFDVMKKIAQRQQQVAKFTNDYAAKHGGRIDYNYGEALQRWANDNPLFPGGASPAGINRKTSTGVQWSIE